MSEYQTWSLVKRDTHKCLPKVPVQYRVTLFPCLCTTAGFTLGVLAGFTFILCMHQIITSVSGAASDPSSTQTHPKVQISKRRPHDQPNIAFIAAPSKRKNIAPGRRLQRRETTIIGAFEVGCPSKICDCMLICSPFLQNELNLECFGLDQPLVST